MRLLGFVCAAAIAMAQPFRVGLANNRGLFSGKSGLWAAEAGNGAPLGDSSNCGAGAEGPGCLGWTGRVSLFPWDSVLGDNQFVQGLQSFASPNKSGNAVGVHDVYVDDEGLFYLTGGIPLPHTVNVTLNDEISCRIFKVNVTGTFDIVNFYAYEMANNVDGQNYDCDPYRFERDTDGSFVVTDAAANAVYRAWVDGSIQTIAVWENTGISQPVPTGIALGKNREIYVGNFFGFPFTTGTSQVRKYSNDGSFEIIGSGFTSLTDLAVDKFGNVWVLEMSPSIPLIGPTNPPFATLTRISKKDGTTSKYLNQGQLILSNGLAIDAQGDFYIGSNTLGGNPYSVCPQECQDTGFIVKWTPPAFDEDNEENSGEKGTVINFNFAGLFANMAGPPARKR